MKNVIAEFDRTIRESINGLTKITEEEDDQLRIVRSGKWTRKETLGHLIDSAANNHYRFVRVQMFDNLLLPTFDQEAWVACQNYRSESWENLVLLWASYNLHLLHIMSCLPVDKQNNRCQIGNGEAVTLRALMENYVNHLKHHLRQILI